MAIGIMTGAISFHLFTPLGVEILGDGGELFVLACGVWISGWIILALSVNDIRMWTGYALNSFGRRHEPEPLPGLVTETGNQRCTRRHEPELDQVAQNERRNAFRQQPRCGHV